MGSDGTFDGSAESLASFLSNLAPQEIVDFERIFGELMDQAYSWPLWGADFIIGGGCSDDGFIDFRGWLISVGREIYERFGNAVIVRLRQTPSDEFDS